MTLATYPIENPRMLALRNAPARHRRPIAADRLKILSALLHEEFATSFLFYDGSTGEPLVDRDEEGPWTLLSEGMPPEVLSVVAGGRPHVSLRGGDHFRLALPIEEADGSTLVAIGELPVLASTAQAARQEQARLLKWLQSVRSRVSSPVCSVTQPRADQHAMQQLKALLEVSKELTGLLGGLEGLGESSDDPNRILQRAAAVLPTETLIWVPPQAGEAVTFEGEHRLSAREARELVRWLSRSPEWDTSGCLISNDAPALGLGTRFPGIVNLMALAVDDQDAGGWLIALNKSDPAAAGGASVVPFRRLDVAILKPFTSLLGLQSRIGRRQSQVQELFAGLIQSLTAAIDAKDSYTCGHSERVARVAVELGRELGLSESDLGDVYLAGLLHDIGKIGVPDSLLGKPGSLTPDEFLQIAEHVLIGCRILEGFGGVAHLLPSVRSHHERYDGTGYPHGLKGEAIPLLARILSVADCYDAMSTARPYRAALAREQIEATLAEGRNRQWDGEVIDAFFRARERIYAIEPRGIGDSVWFALHAPETGLHPHHAGR
jgi:hypothetical protein